MKHTPTLLVCFAISIFGITSCKKESTSTDPISPVTVDSFYIDKIYSIYDNGSGSDTQNVATYHYDALKRLISITDSILNPSSGADSLGYTFFYNGTDTLPYKTVLMDNIDNGWYFRDEIVFHYYNASQQKIKDSVLSSFSGIVYTRVTNYSYVPGKMVGTTVQTYTQPSPGIQLSKDTATFDGNGNIVHNVKYVMGVSDYELSTTSDFTYDNKVNPLSKLNVFRSFNYFPSGETLNLELLSFNNILSQNEVTLPPNQFGTNRIYTYTYNSHGLVSNSYMNFGTDSDIQIYTYRSL